MFNIASVCFATFPLPFYLKRFVAFNRVLTPELTGEQAMSNLRGQLIASPVQ
jgi:hypothetical protein